jgi:hypothetical protein
VPCASYIKTPCGSLPEHLESFFAQVEAQSRTSLPEFVKEEFDAFLERGILAHGFLRLRYASCAHEKLVAFSCKRRGFCPSCGARRMVEAAAHLVDHVIPAVPVRQRVVSLPIPLRILFAAHAQLLTPLLRIIHGVIARFLIKQAGIKASEAPTPVRSRSSSVSALRRISTSISTAWCSTGCIAAVRARRCSARRAPRASRSCKRYWRRSLLACCGSPRSNHNWFTEGFDTKDLIEPRSGS